MSLEASQSGRTRLAMTVILVNRDSERARRAAANVAGLNLTGADLKALVLSDLPEGERTFKSRTDNALESLPVEATTGGFTVELRPYSITAVLVRAR